MYLNKTHTPNTKANIGKTNAKNHFQLGFVLRRSIFIPNNDYTDQWWRKTIKHRSSWLLTVANISGRKIN